MPYVYVCAYTIGIEFEWSAAKAAWNVRKHGVDFADAVAALDDELALTMEDELSEGERRWITLGMDALERLLFVIYAWRGERRGNKSSTRNNDETGIRCFKGEARSGSEDGAREDADYHSTG